MIQRLPIALAQIKGDNTSESFLKWNMSIIIFFLSRKRSYFTI